MALDEFGKLAVAEIVFYIPVFGMALFSAVKNGFGKGEGWLNLVIFSLSVFLQLNPPKQELTAHQKFGLLDLLFLSPRRQYRTPQAVSLLQQPFCKE